MLEALQFNGGAVVVTGGGTGIGQACCVEFARLGAKVIATGRTRETLEETRALLKQDGHECDIFEMDVTKSEGVERLRTHVEDRYGSVKALINNAGNNFRSTIEDLSEDDWHRLIDVDLTSVFLMSKAFLPLLRKHDGGASIVNNASVYGLVGNPLMPVYCAAKGGVLSLTRQLAVDYGPENIRVNAVCPGPAWSPRVRGYIESGKSSEERLTSKVLLGRIAECSEIAHTMVFLASDAASYIHGTSLAVDGRRWRLYDPMTETFTLKPLNPHIGARVEGIDVSKPMDDATADALQAALIEHLVLVFPEQDLTEDDQIAFAARFGPLSRHFRPDTLRTDGKPAANPSVMMITNERRGGKPVGYLPDGEIYFHTDSCFTETPQRAVCLYALELPSTGGDTIFASACRLLDTLPEKIRARLAGRSAVNCYEFGVTIKQVDKFDRSKWPHFRHPAIAHDERDGRDYLYVNELMTEEIEGLSEAENRETLDAIFDHIRKSPDSYWHLWQPGDLVLWDNRRALHARVDFPADEPRKLRRVPIADDRPVVMAGS